MSRIDRAIETYDDYEAVLAGRLLRAYDIELDDRLQRKIQRCWAAQLAVDCAMTTILGE